MDMEMDDEVEWLEANYSHLQEETDHLDFYYQQQETLNPSPNKRLRSYGPDLTSPSHEEKANEVLEEHVSLRSDGPDSTVQFKKKRCSPVADVASEDEDWVRSDGPDSTIGLKEKRGSNDADVADDVADEDDDWVRSDGPDSTVLSEEKRAKTVPSDGPDSTVRPEEKWAKTVRSDGPDSTVRLKEKWVKTVRSDGPDSTVRSEEKRAKTVRSDGPDSTIRSEEKRGKTVKSDDPDSAIRSEEKRGKNVLDEDDDDWFRSDGPDLTVRSEEERGRKVVADVAAEKIVARFAFEIKGDCVPITGVEGERVYAMLRGVEERESIGRLDVKRDNFHGLISEPIHILMHRVETEAFAKALQVSVESESDTIHPQTPVASEKLWVDKYSPSSFMELLSDEQTNREVLLWLKQWDPCVFGSEIRATADDVLSSLRHHSSVVQKHKFSNKNFSGKYRESRSGFENFKGHHHSDNENNDPKGIAELGNKKIKGSGPPEHKILLLCGPPGLGKTTLAHVAAKHCGYRVVEINASDDRSTSTIEGKILDVVQMNSVMADSKPKCLVIDEIDGALGDGKGAVEVILKMTAENPDPNSRLSAEKKSSTGKENANDEQQGKSSSRKKHKAASLSRPVICICNDLYAPALRPLRQVAQVHVFVQPTVSRVVNRLKYICNNEGLKTSSIALGALAECTECDIRSCLNTLQFLHKKKESLNVLDISSQVVGRKDTLKSVFDIWKEIFQKRKVKSERKLDDDSTSKFKDFEFMHSLVANRGDYDLILDGVHENILQLHYHDPGMQKTVKCLHSLGVSDLVHQYIMRTQKMSLLAYQPNVVVYIRSLVAQNQRPNIEWPKSFQRSRTMLMERTETFRSWHNKISPPIARHISTKSLVEDSISPLLHILSPPKLRPVAVQLLSEKEKNDFVQLVNTMVAYSVTYKHLKSDPVFNQPKSEAVGDTSMLSFDPPLANLINFKGYTSGHFALAAAVKQILVHEVEKQKILQCSINRSIDAIDLGGTGKLTQQGEGEISIPQSSSSRINIQNSKVLANPRQFKSTAYHAPHAPGSSLITTANVKVGSPVETKKRAKTSVNFFDRFRKSGSNGSQQANNTAKKPATLERDSRPLLFKFNEGYTNAVKRPVRIHEFLL